MSPLVWLVVSAIDLYLVFVYAWVILGLLLYFKIANRTHPLVVKLNYSLNRLILPALRPIRKKLPALDDMDISPIILIFALHFVQYTVLYYAG